MPTMKVNDINMYYEIHGKGAPIVCIAGFSADTTTWLPILPFLQDQYQIILFDNRGAGQTDVPAGKYNIEQMADDTAALCEKLNIHEAHFVGNSMGGFILQALARKFSQLVRSAVMSHSAMRAACVFHLYVSAQMQLLKANAPLHALIQASCCWAFSYQFLSRPGMLEQLIEFGLNKPFPFTITGHEGQFAAIDSFDSREWVKDIRARTLVMSSDQDLIFNEGMVKALADNIPNASYYCFKDCGHLPMLECPEIFCKVITAFYKDQTRDR